MIFQVNDECLRHTRLTFDVPKHIECDSCGTVLLGIGALGPSPIDREACPNCGGDSFAFVD